MVSENRLQVMEAAFTEARERWDERNDDIDLRAARYFFFAGAAFGTEVTAGIYSGAYQRPQAEEVVGEPV